MAELPLLNEDLNIIQHLDDEPNDVGGLTSAELKAEFDKAANIIKKFLNETLIPAVVTDNATAAERTEQFAQMKEDNESAVFKIENMEVTVSSVESTEAASAELSVIFKDVTETINGVPVTSSKECYRLWLKIPKGYTPVKGTDYWTATDKQGIVNDVLAALPAWEGGSY